MPLGIRLGSSTTAAATTGPASGPRPASSQPATGQTPRLISARSRRKLGGETAITLLAGLPEFFPDLSRIMAGIVRKRVPRCNRELRAIPVIQALEQTELLTIVLRPGEMIGGQFRAALVEPELLAGDLEPPPDHPGHRSGALHPRSPLRVVVAAAAHVADQGEDVAIAVGIIRHQPLAEQVAHLERQPQQHVGSLLDAGVRRGVED